MLNMFFSRMKDHGGLDRSLVRELKSCCALEDNFLPRKSGLKMMESTENVSGVSAKCRDARVEELWGLTSFFGYGTHTFVQAVNLLDRFLTVVKAQPKHVPCIAVCCLHLAASVTEEESNVAPSRELIRISQSKFTVSDLCRMEKVISVKLSWERGAAVTAFTFLHLYHSALACVYAEGVEIPSIGRLEAQLKACLCRLVFSKAKSSVLALALVAHAIDTLESFTASKIVQHLQRHTKIGDSELLCWQQLVAKCMNEYSSSQCHKPDNKKLVWIVSRRTALGLHTSHVSVPGLPTIPEGSWDESESEDSCEDMNCGGDSPCGSLGSNGEGSFFPALFHSSSHKATR
ncbi:cyclin-G2-like [Dunckerocampus dactyliophorus]|uniref:cyclin-G2-like n=1 Tax=Dunckerocampus dactyliophorus TaxID=161453 RepID=UPI002407396C|nr:cyclin-G2-like [Dunckerocampus dactyliophorus]